MTDADRDLLMLALLAYAEARSEGQDGIRAQIHSTLNRHRARKWFSGATLAETIMMPYAYSAMNTDDPNRRAAMRDAMAGQLMTLCMGEAVAALAAATEDPTGGATHYYADGTREPTWVSGIRSDGTRAAPAATFCKQIGRHRFYTGVA
jgi:N-acetylmuramoyl-L-alanine amidase